VEGHLLAPCCYQQTLDVHQSPEADALRGEVRTRLGQGETPDQIEDDFATRYGERVRAVPRGHDRRHYVVIGTGVALLVVALALVRALRRWRAKPAAPPPKAPDIAFDPYDARLDEELADLDG
jgi:cytochrome c-type biogenesis protein CcmH